MSPRLVLHLRWLAPVAAAGVAASAAAALTLRSPSGPEAPTSVLGGQVVKGDGDEEAARPFVVSGDVTDLAPGVTRPLHLRLMNPNDGGISVQTLQVTVGDSATGCSGDSLRVAAFRGSVFVPSGGEVRVTLGVTMAGSASPVCQGATFPLTYGGSAVKA